MDGEVEGDVERCVEERVESVRVNVYIYSRCSVSLLRYGLCKKTDRELVKLGLENERNLKESLAVSAIKSNPNLNTYAKNNAKIKAMIGSLIKNNI